MRRDHPQKLRCVGVHHVFDGSLMTVTRLAPSGAFVASDIIGGYIVTHTEHPYRFTLGKAVVGQGGDEMTKVTRRQLFDLAESQNLHIATWSPGDGVTRYRFIDKRSEPHWQWDYDATKHPLYTAHGLREASVWLLGYASGLNTKWKREQMIESD